jgi:hypothetical protein
MTKQQYDEQMEQLKNEFNEKKKNVMRYYVAANNPYKIGDIVTDHIGTIKIEKITVGQAFSKYPCAVYFGIELKKNLEPKKSGNKRSVWQTNII